jgi:hypothetical protein
MGPPATPAHYREQQPWYARMVATPDLGDAVRMLVDAVGDVLAHTHRWTTT